MLSVTPDQRFMQFSGVPNFQRPFASLTPQRVVMNRSFAGNQGKEFFNTNPQFESDHLTKLLKERERELNELKGTLRKKALPQNSESVNGHLESLVYEKDLFIEKLTEENDRLKHSKIESDKRISSLLSENQRLNTTCVRRLEEIERLMHQLKGQEIGEIYQSSRQTDENLDINDQRNFSDFENYDYERRINLLKTENAILTKKLNHQNQQLEEMNIEFQKSDALYHNMEISEERTRELLLKVEDYEKKIEILLAENEKLNTILTERFGELEYLKEVEEDNHNLKEQLQMTINQIAYLEGKTSESERINSHLSLERNRVLEVEAKIEKLIDENNKLVDINEVLRNETDALATENNRFLKEKQRCEDAEERLIVMESDLEHLKSLLQEKESSLRSHSSRAEHVIRGEIALEFGTKITMLGAEIDRLYSIIEELSEELIMWKAKSEENRHPNNYVSSLNEEYEEKINTEVKKIRGVQYRMEEECQEYEARLFSIQNERQVLLNEIEKWKKKYKLSEENVSSLSEVEWNYRNAQNEVERLSFALNEKSKEVEYLSKKITDFERLVMRNVDYEKKIKDLAIENDRLNSIIISRCREMIEYR